MHFLKKNVGVVGVLVVSTAACVLLGGTGCAAQANPPAEETTVGGDVTNGTAPTAFEPIRCEVGSSRACQKVWFDFRGQKHCTASQQHCAATGEGWLECGAPAPALPTNASSDLVEDDAVTEAAAEFITE